MCCRTHKVCRHKKLALLIDQAASVKALLKAATFANVFNNPKEYVCRSGIAAIAGMVLMPIVSTIGSTVKLYRREMVR